MHVERSAEAPCHYSILSDISLDIPGLLVVFVYRIPYTHEPLQRTPTTTINKKHSRLPKLG